MLSYAEKLTKQSSNINKKNIDNLKSLGLEDKDILELNQVIAYFNYVNRIVDGLGVQLEKERRTTND